MPLDTKFVAKWTPKEWQQRVFMVRASGGGAQGVLFCFVGNTKDYSPANAAFVVKPITGSAANVQFAEKVLSKVAGAKSLNSVGVKRNSPLGKEIVATIDRALAVHKAGKHAVPDPKRLEEVRPHYDSADTFLIQSLAAGMNELGDVYRTADGLIEVLRNATLMKNLGRLYVADAVLGNGDRLDAMNTGNVAFDATGTIFAIDSAAVLANFETIVKDAAMGGRAGTQLSKRDKEGDRGNYISAEKWAGSVLKGGLSAPTKRDLGAAAAFQVPTARMDMLFDPEKNWKRFRDIMSDKLTAENDRLSKANQPVLPQPSADDWKAAREPFIAGVLSGLKRVDTLLGGMSWLKTKATFKALTDKHGKDTNMDWTNFKLRRLVVREARNGATYEAARDTALAYVKRKKGSAAF
ncbi:MAG TPA: hypothetical protein VFZ21_31975 [Gemmatimonadaceae bacterium]|jgi:hypothetical protein|nr:hypothetical protein [Gemmatimonadaceae bacterium]